MGEVTLADIVKFVQDGGTIAVLLIIMWGGVKRWWVFGWAYRECDEEREEWKGLALRGLTAADKAVTLAGNPERVKP